MRRRSVLLGAVSVTALAVLLLSSGIMPLGPDRAGAARAAGWTSAGRLQYATTNGRPLWLDEYVPHRHRGRLPAVLVVHGGGWAHGSPAGFSEMAERLAAAGFAVFDVDYTLASSSRPGLAVQPEQIEAAIRWITGHARALDLDPGPIGALGSSAGGNLVARVVLVPGERDLKAVVTWSGPMDLTDFAPLVARSCRGEQCGAHWLATDLLDYVGCRPITCPARWSLGSPLEQVRRGAPAMLMFNSAHELVPLTGTLSFEARLHRAGDSARLVVYPGSRHAGEYAGTALAPTIAFFRAELGPKSAARRHPALRNPGRREHRDLGSSGS